MNTITMPEALSFILKRRSVRNYTGQQVDDGSIEWILRAAMVAPAAVSQYPWKFIVIRNTRMLRNLAAGLPYTQGSIFLIVHYCICLYGPGPVLFYFFRDDPSKRRSPHAE
jgi:nitroreductase